MTDYEWVTDEMFDRKLAEILDKMTGEQILQTGSAYDVFSEALNNQVLEELVADREEAALPEPSVAKPRDSGGEWKGGHNR